MCYNIFMCGIVGYIGTEESVPILLHGLEALEYRGYDSAGVSFATDAGIITKKSLGKVKELGKILPKHIESHLGIAHTRWATHGVPSEKNAHPHTDCSGRIFVVHNGIIENYKELKAYLAGRGHIFISETDTEVVPHLIEEFLKTEQRFDAALIDTLKMIKGAYALAILDANDPDTLYAARLSSPLVIGVGKGEYFLASDPSAILEKTKKVMYLGDGEMATITKKSVEVVNLEKKKTPVEITNLEWNLEQAQKGDFPHFMLKEIFEGPDVVKAAISGRVDAKKGAIKLGGLEAVRDRLKKAKRALIVACGTSYYAGLVGEYLLEEIAGMPTEVQFASEFRYRDEPLEKDTVVIAISQSGETADTLAALVKAEKAGLLTLGVVNVVGSSIARTTDAGVYNHAGPEISVASTKAFISQITTLALIASYLTKDADKRHGIIAELVRIPEKIKAILDQSGAIKKIAEKYKHYQDFLFLGRKYNYPAALEGALKLKEISYIHAEGCAAGEMKHGPIAMVSPEFPTVAIVPTDSVLEKTLSNLEEICARRGPILAIATEGNKDIASIARDVIFIPKTIEALQPILAVVPLQLFAYHVSAGLGLDVDRPRNLAKSVTVE